MNQATYLTPRRWSLNGHVLSDVGSKSRSVAVGRLLNVAEIGEASVEKIYPVVAVDAGAWTLGPSCASTVTNPWSMP